MTLQDRMNDYYFVVYDKDGNYKTTLTGPKTDKDAHRQAKTRKDAQRRLKTHKERT